MQNFSGLASLAPANPEQTQTNPHTHTHIDVYALKGKCKLMFTDGTTKLLNWINQTVALLNS